MIGAAMVAAAAVAFAFFGLYRIKLRLELIRELRHITAMISSYIGFSQLPLEELITEVLKKTDGRSAPAFEYFLKGLNTETSISKLWRKSLGRLPLKADEAAVFAPLGDCLGMTDKSLQQHSADLVINEAASCEQKISAALEKYKSELCGSTYMWIFFNK